MKLPISPKQRTTTVGTTVNTYKRYKRFQQAEVREILGSYSYLGSLDRRHQAVIQTKNPLVDGWRKPSPYQCLAQLNEREAYDYQYWDIGDRYQIEAKSTDTIGQYGPPASINDWGLKLVTGTYYPDVPDYVVNESIAKAKEALRDIAVNLPVAYAEMGKTLSFIASVANRILRSFLMIMRNGKNFGKAIKYLTGTKPSGNPAATTWLEYSYALRPLMADIYGALELMKSSPIVNGELLNVSAIHSTDLGFPSFSGFDYVKQSGQCAASARTVLYYKVGDQMRQVLNRGGLLNPAEVLWELLPFSFVLDWFISIGTMLKDFSSLESTFDFVAGATTQKMERDHTVTVVKNTGNKLFMPPWASEQFYGTFPTVHYRTVCIYRTVHNSFPVATLYVKLPFGSTPITSAISLLAVATRERGSYLRL